MNGFCLVFTPLIKKDKKKTIQLFVLVSAIVLSINAAQAQVLREGNVVVDAFYGFPNLYTAIFKNAYAASGAEQDLKISGIGPLGIRGEYMVADNFGVGADINFNNTTIEYTENSVNSNNQPIVYNYDLRTQKLNLLLTFNYHFIKNSDNFDAYLSGGAGYGNRTFTFDTNDPGFTSEDTESLLPVALRLAIGTRYFFNEHVGLNAAIGLGGPLLSFGFSAKF